MVEKRTDLATEINEICNPNSTVKGVKLSEERMYGIRITTVTIMSEGEKYLNKPAGTYITVDIGRAWEADRPTFENTAKVICEMLKRIAGWAEDDSRCYLAAGFGNENITSDSIGPKTVSKLLVTRHLKQSDNRIFEQVGFGNIAAVAPGVLAQTGIESSEEVSCIAKQCNAKCIIAIDSLASRRLSRLSTTVQISDTGISPGSGVYNTRNELTRNTTGVPVIAIGVPTVVEAATLAYDLLEDTGLSSESINEKLLFGKGKSMFVTPKESDIISEKLSRLIADGINMFVHKNLTLDEMQEYTS